ncbi:hypothetical protein HN51_057755 [Arachis hypogaea]|uniref:F-box domain-containing protein n=2 Tax=Arachis TaxID=3817 RepID=A0A444WY55_ARAHY|nr:F-box protein [Arachis hypogaea]RYQ82374.1 hypothetical protein Ahy_B10g100963 [Arachis hypogaea]
MSSPCTLTFRRKRVVVSNKVQVPLKRMCSDKITLKFECSPLEALPLDILIKVVCGVEHEDLHRLFHVSKAIREAALVAKDLHFEYSTPRNNTFALYNPFDMDGNGLDEIEAPNKQLKKCKSRLSGGNLSLTLFPSMDEGDY